MIATVFEVIERNEHAHVRLASLNNFRLREQGQLPASDILENPYITLYSLDFEHKQAVFVEMPTDVDLSQAPFVVTAQHEHAKRVWTISFEALLMLAQAVDLDDSRLVSIYSVGRCGSTLASQIFAQIPGVINISEPAVLSQLVVARNIETDPDDDLILLLEASIRLLCKTPAETVWVIKGQSFVIELADWLHKLYPQTRNLFLYRHAETWLRSGLRAFGQGTAETDEESWQGDKKRREILGPLVPSIAQYDPNQPLPHAGSLSLMWLRAMERYVDHCHAGIEMLAIRYESWRSSPRQTAVAMLDYCHCRPADMTAVYEALNRDSQAASHLSRDTLGQRQRVLTDDELAELHKHLQAHGFIHEADFEVPNTI
ncbi:MAG: hypothetical protein IAF02_24140 [Anaerolineae bacterium]|nr:hypothetical protein [Anaerolineae bacterium]